MEYLFTDHHRVHWVDGAGARRLAWALENDRARRRTHHVSRLLVADGNFVVHGATDPALVRALGRHILAPW